MNRTIEKIRSFTVSPGIEKNEGNFRAPPRDPHPLRRRFIVFSLQNNRYSIPACRLASPLSLSRQFHLPLVRVSSTFRPDVLELLTKLWIIALCRRSGSSRLAMTLRSNRGSAPLSRAGESWRGATTNLWVWPRRRNGEPWSQWRKNSDDKAGSSKQLRKQEVQCCCYNNRKIRRFLNRALRVG